MKTTKGRIIKQISNTYTVSVEEKSYECKARGKFRKMNINPTVGDIVKFDIENNYILEILPRKNKLTRPAITNIDQAVIITSLKKPNLDTNLLDKLLCIIEYNNIKPIIIFTKSDLLTPQEQKKYKKHIEYYKKYYETYMNNELTKIKKIFKNKTSVFTGQSGAGKSTLLNKLDKTLNIKTGEISQALNRGKHTTRHTSLIKIYEGLVADTPGFSAISLENMQPIDIRDNFADFNTYRGKCKYKDCLHHKEENCIIKEKVENETILPSRYKNYINFITKG